MDTSFYLALAGSISLPVLFVLLWIKSRRKRAGLIERPEDEIPVEGTEADLRAAEASQRDWAGQNARVRLVEDHVLLDRYNTIDGYSDVYMEDLTNFLRKSGVRCEGYFQETVPPGVGISVIARHGVHELYVYKDQADEALRIIEEFKNR